MRTSLVRLIVIAGLLIVCRNGSAVPVTGGTGPGGIGLTDGSSSLELWYKADTLSQANNTTVTSWSDSSGNGRTATVAGGTPLFNTNVLNGNLPVVSFGGAGAAMGFTNIPLPTFSIFGMVRSTGDRYIYSHNANNRQIRVRQGGGANLSSYNGAENPISTATVTPAANFFNAEYLVDSVSDSEAFFESGAARGTGTLTNGIDGLNRLAPDTGTGATMAVAETAIYSTRLNGTQRILVENALSSKWDVAMLANDKYAGDNVGLDHDFGVVGIGNDGTNSVLSGGHEGFGIEVGSLSSNTWALAGHDDGPNGVTFADMTAGQRWERTWYIDTTGVATADLAFDWQDAQNTATFDPSLIGLYYRSGTSGIFSPVGVGVLDLANQRVDFTGIPLQDGFYTLGAGPVPEPSTALLVSLGLLGLARYRRRRRSAAATRSASRG